MSIPLEAHGILRGLSAETFNAPLPGQSNSSGINSADARSPEIEALTLPPSPRTLKPSLHPDLPERYGADPEPACPANDHTYGQVFLENDTYMADPI
ncbi:hypothetical protein BDV97DRAFT_402446 [Delphinella strobiligena]|nr:hypothetical protein BDV97DRAFT_402446 [Delphinella strobiligena]